MGYKCTFMDNDIYSADDVNAVFSYLTSAGVVLQGSENVLSDLNTITSEIVTDGVQNSIDSCKVTKTDGVYKIGKGVCFMHDGSAIAFDEDGYEISPIPDSDSYVYLKRSRSTNTIDVVVSDSEGDAESVPLCKIDMWGNISDKRRYSKAKVQLTSETALKEIIVTLDLTNNNQAISIDTGSGAFSYVAIMSVRNQYTSTASILYPTGKNLYKLENDEQATVPLGKNIYGSTASDYYFTKHGANLEIAYRSGGRPDSATFTLLVG